MNAKETVLQAARWLASCAATLACWAVWLVLGGTLASLAVIAFKHEVPVPDFLLRRIEREFASAQLAVRFGRADLDPTGRILLQNVEVRSAGYDDPLLVGRLVYTRLDFWSLLAGRALPDEVQLEGAALLVPAPLSPTGAAEPLVRDFAAVLRHRDERWHLDHLSGRIGRLQVVATGQIAPPPHQAGRKPPRLEDILTGYLKLGRRILPELSRLEAFDDPALNVGFTLEPGAASSANIVFTTQAVRRPWGVPVTAGPLSATTTLRFAPDRVVPVRIAVTARKVDFDGKVAAWDARARVAAVLDPARETLVPGDVRFSAATIAALGEMVLHPRVRADFSAWPRLPVQVAAVAGGRLLAGDGDVDVAQKSARFRIEGVVSPALFADIAGRHAATLEREIKLIDPATVRAELTLAPGWKFARAGLDLDARRAVTHRVALDLARGHIDFDGRSLLARDALLVVGENRAAGSYWMDTQTRDYRMLLTGCLRPPAIDAWCGAWWPSFWADFAFPATPPQADIDLAGRWGDGTRTVFFGNADSGRTVLRGVDFDEVHLALHLRHRFVHVSDLTAKRDRGAQRLGGWFKRYGDEATNVLKSVEFDIGANLDPPLYGRLLDQDLTAALAPWKLTQAPQVHAAGRINHGGATAGPSARFAAQTAGALHYHDFPLEHAAVTGAVRGDELRLDAVELGFAGGTAAGRATVRGTAAEPRLEFDANLKDVDLARAIRDVEAFEAARAGAGATRVTESKFIKRATGGRLEAAFAAEGRPGVLATFKGKGHAHITGAELAEVHLFGLLSQLLSGVGLGFTSLRLDQARADFQLEASRLHFNELRVTGRNAALDARGDYRLDTKTLDFTARLSPFEESRALIPKLFDLVTNPLTSFLELKLSGPLSSPNWSFALGPTNILRALVGAEPTPPPPAPTVIQPPPAQADAGNPPVNPTQATPPKQ
jgi:hypothetical protein